MRWPLREQILWPLVLGLAVTLLAVSLLNGYLATRRMRAERETQLRGAVQTLAEGTFPLNDVVLRQTAQLSGAEFAATDRDDRPLARSNPAFQVPPAELPPVPPEGLALDRTVAVAGGSYFHVVVRLDRRAATGGPERLHVFYPEAPWQAASREAFVSPLLVGSAALVGAILLALVIASRVSEPIGDLKSHVERIAAGDFSPAPTPATNDELRDLAAAVNRLSEMLAGYEREVRRSEQRRTLDQLGAGMAHQMRNSVTGCRIALDLHRRVCAARPGDDTLDVAVRQLMLLERYVQRFLAPGESRPLEKRPTDVGQLVAATIALVQPSAVHAGVEIHSELPAEPAVIAADGDALEQMLVNLLINALEAARRDALPGRGVGTGPTGSSPPGDAPRPTIVAALLPESGGVRLEIRDTGPGPPPELRERLFEPFVTGKAEGTGLGLSVARDIVAEHGGTIGWERRGAWTVFVVRLPRSPGD